MKEEDQQRYHYESKEEFGLKYLLILLLLLTPITSLAQSADDWEAHLDRVAEILSLINEGPQAIPTLLEFLHDEEHEIHQISSIALWKIGPLGIQALIQAIEEGDPLTRQKAVMALSLVESHDSPVDLEFWIDLLSDPDSEIRFWAVVTLEIKGPRAIGATEAIERLLKDEDKEVRNTAANALWAIHSQDRFGSLQDPNYQINYPLDWVLVQESPSRFWLKDPADPRRVGFAIAQHQLPFPFDLEDVAAFRGMEIDSFPGFIGLSHGYSTTGGRIWRYFIYEFADMFRVWDLVTSDGDTYTIMTCLAPRDEFNEYVPYFHQIVNSLIFMEE